MQTARLLGYRQLPTAYNPILLTRSFNPSTALTLWFQPRWNPIETASLDFKVVFATWCDKS